jgi:hypothetical protein
MCAVDVDVQEHLFGAIGDDHGTEAADRLCEAGVTLFGVDAAVISLVFDGTNTGTLGASPAPARVCGELRAASVPLARAASVPSAAQRSGDTYASPLIATSSSTGCATMQSRLRPVLHLVAEAHHLAVAEAEAASMPGVRNSRTPPSGTLG